jgi:hypothetical protein
MRHSNPFNTASAALGLAVALLVAAGPAGAAETKSPKAAAKAKKAELIQSEDVDFDGDGKNETVGVCKNRKGFFLCVFEHDDEIVTMSAQSGKLSGKKVRKIQVLNLFKPEKAKEIAVELYAETPDEKIKRLYVFAGTPKLRPIFKTAIFRSKDKAERMEWDRDPSVVKWGNANPGWYFQDLEMDGITEIMVRKSPKLLKVPVKGGHAKVVVGVTEKVYSLEGGPESGRYELINGSRFVDFAPRLEISNVKVSSQHLPKDLADQMKADAMADALYGEGTDKPAETKVDDSEYRMWVADGNYDTGWIEGAKGSGKGESVEIFLSDRSNVHMIRLVAGCTMDKRSYRKHNVPTSFTVSLDGMQKSEVNRKRLKSPDGAAVGIMEMPLKDRPWAKQTLIFFDGKTSTGRVVVELGRAKKQGKGNHTCISEIAVH